MRRRGWGVILSCLGPVLLASGCTGTDMLDTGNTSATLVVEFANTSTRFTDSATDRFELDVTAMWVRPPAGTPADEALGDLPINPLETTVRVDALKPPATAVMTLPSGQFRVLRISVNQITMRDADWVTGMPGCPNYQPRLTSGNFQTRQPSEPTFVVNREGGSQLTLRFDVAALANLIQGLFTTCRSGTFTLTGSSGSNQRQQIEFAGPTYITVAQ